MEYMGLDIWMEILSRLCVKDLIRLKSVSKAFLDLISTLISKDDFIRLHLNKSSFRAIHLNNCSHLCLKQHREAESSLRVINMHIETFLACFNHYGGYEIEIGTLFYGRLYGSCNGLVLCRTPKHDSKYRGGVLLWNPALHEAEFIPIKMPQQLTCNYWFGYDNNEYKLVLGTDSHIHLIRLYVDTGSWKSSLNINKNYSHFQFHGTLVHRTVHWPAYYLVGHEYIIISYDLRNETVGRIVMPDGMTFQSSITFLTFLLGQVDGCLSAMFAKQFTTELWVMKEYGVGKSWTKLMNLPNDMFCIYRRPTTMPYVVELDDPAQLCSPIYGKEFYVESLISPRSIRQRFAH